MMINKNTFFLFTNIYNVGYLLLLLYWKYNIIFTFKIYTIYIIFDTCKCIQCLLLLLLLKYNYINER